VAAELVRDTEMKNTPVTRKHDLFGRVPEVAAAAVSLSLDSREGRIATLAWVADELIASDDPRKIWAGSALKAGLENGKHLGDLEKHFLRIAGEQGSRSTPAEVLRRIKRS
jgi:hypothetical protein